MGPLGPLRRTLKETSAGLCGFHEPCDGQFLFLTPAKTNARAPLQVYLRRAT